MSPNESHGHAVYTGEGDGTLDPPLAYLPLLSADFAVMFGVHT